MCLYGQNVELALSNLFNRATTSLSELSQIRTKYLVPKCPSYTIEVPLYNFTPIEQGHSLTLCTKNTVIYKQDILSDLTQVTNFKTKYYG